MNLHPPPPAAGVAAAAAPKENPPTEGVDAGVAAAEGVLAKGEEEKKERKRVIILRGEPRRTKIIHTVRLCVHNQLARMHIIFTHAHTRTHICSISYAGEASHCCTDTYTQHCHNAHKRNARIHTHNSPAEGSANNGESSTRSCLCVRERRATAAQTTCSSLSAGCTKN